MTSNMRLRALSETVAGAVSPEGLEEGVEGVQRRSLSLARQWGRIGEGRGRRLSGCDRSLGTVTGGPLVSAGEGNVESKRAGLESVVLEGAADQLVFALSFGSRFFGCLPSSALLAEYSGGAGGVLSFP